MITSGTVILVSQDKCADKSTFCRMLWSGALAAESKFANEYYAWWMAKNGYPAEPPAQACPVPKGEILLPATSGLSRGRSWVRVPSAQADSQGRDSRTRKSARKPPRMRPMFHGSARK